MDMHTVVLIAFYLLILLYAIILHEIAHGLAALAMGDRTAKNAGRLTLNPVPHIDPVGSILIPMVMLLLSGFRFAFGWARPVPYDPRNLPDPRWDSVKVALAGPLMNFTLALLAALTIRLLPVSQETVATLIGAVMSGAWQEIAHVIAGAPAAIVAALCVMVIFWNVLLGVFNLLPLPPLDGAKVLYAIVPLPPQTQMMLEQYGFVIVLAVVVFAPAVLMVPLNIVYDFFFRLAM